MLSGGDRGAYRNVRRQSSGGKRRIAPASREKVGPRFHGAGKKIRREGFIGGR